MLIYATAAQMYCHQLSLSYSSILSFPRSKVLPLVSICLLRGRVIFIFPATSKEEAKLMAYELVDWVRLIDLPLTEDNIRRVWVKIEQVYSPALKDLVDFLDPTVQYTTVPSLCESVAPS